MANDQLKLFKHFTTKELFTSKKISLSKDNDSYIDPDTELEVLATPEILWEDICFIDSPKLIWTHGVYHNGEDLSDNDNTYELYLDNNGVLSCIKNTTGEGFALSETGTLSLA